MNTKLTLALAFCLLCGTLAAQNPALDLPRFRSEAEKWQMETTPPPAPAPIGITTPPTVPVRSMAEWEELQALLITWNGQSAILAEIVRAAREECRVIINCNTPNVVTTAQNYLISKNVDITSNVEFVVAPNNSIWVRDYGPNCVYANDVDSLYFVDWIYNRPARPQDDTIATKIAPYLGVPLYSTSAAPTDMVHTGGNFMSDGIGTAFSSSLILNENQPGNPYGVSTKTEAQINSILADFMGIDRYIKMTPLPYDVIHHIDMHMKLLDEETLLVGQYPTGIADGPQIEANIQYVLSNFQSAFGTPYKIVRIPMPPEGNAYPNNGGDYRTYANAVFVNKTIIVPFYQQQYDTTAQRIWEEAMPGYNVVGINCNSIIPSLGAIHCITKEIGVPDPLRILHQKLPTCMESSDWPLGYPVWATLQHRSGIASAKIHYALAPDGPWQVAELPYYLNDDTTWTHKGYIPLQASGSTIYYYIEANANNGKTLTRPLPAPAGWWKFCATGSVSSIQSPSAELLDIYPNPAAAITVIPVNTTKPARGNILIYNALGQKIKTVFEGEIPAGASNYFVNAAELPAGTYLVKLQTGNQVVLKKLAVR